MATLDRHRASASPAAVLTLGLVVIGALIVPALGMHLGMPGAKVVDKGNTSRDGYDMLVSAFGPGAAAPAFITTPAADAPTVARIASTVPGVVDARVVTPPAATGRVVVRVTGSTAVDDSRTATLVNTLRSRLSSAVPTAQVGGPAAQNRDLTAVLVGRAPYAIGVILIVAFLLLLIVFRSLVIALTSILMNLLTVGAAFGFATLVFQHGFGTGLLGIQHQPFVDAWAPLFFFALLFGLSMDYQLFLLAASAKSRGPVARPLPPCKTCGGEVPHPDRGYCDTCLPTYRREQFEQRFSGSGLAKLEELKADGHDPTHAGEAATKRGAMTTRRKNELREWEQRYGKLVDLSVFQREILPLIQGVPLSQLVKATGLSLRYCSQIRRGEKRPHPRHWAALGQAVEGPAERDG